jgi:rhodanese-related sulfurtransferase
MKINYRIPAFLMLMIVLANCGQKTDHKNGAKTKPGISELSPEEFKSKLASTPDAVLIDVRTPEEVAEGMIEGAVNIDYSDSGFTESIGSLDSTKSYFLYCKTAKRSTGAAEKMTQLGFQNIYVLQGGINNWQEKGLGLVRP